jgi:integrase
MGGSIREKRRGVWELRIYLGRDDDGKVRHRQLTFHGAKREAQRELNRLVAELEFGNEHRDEALREASADPDWGPKTTFNDAIEGWRLNGWADLSPNTTKRYQSLWDNHIRSSIGTKRIASTGPYVVERFLRDMKAGGQSKSSVHQARAMLHRACRLARKWSSNLLPNPVADTEMPEWKLQEQPAEQRSPSAGEVRALLAAAADEDVRLEAFIRVVAATGARRSEVCALRWNEIDPTVPSLVIDEATVVDGGVVGIKGPKSRASIRSVAIDGGTLAVLQALRIEREAIAAECEITLAADGFVFSTDPSAIAPPNPDGMTEAFSRIRHRAGVAPDIHIHSLRHFQATELDPVISESQKQARLGWATVQMARHYTGRIDEEDIKAATHIGGVLGETDMAASRAARRSALRFPKPAPS